MKRRQFLGTPAAATLAWYPDIVHAAPATKQQLLHVAVSLSAHPSPVPALLVERAVNAVVPGGAGAVRKHISQVQKELEGAKTLAHQTRALLSPSAVELGLPRQVAAALRTGALAETPSGFEEVLRVGHPGLRRHALDVLQKDVAQKAAASWIPFRLPFGLSSTDQLLNSVAGAMGQPPEYFTKPLRDLLPPAAADLGTDLDKLWQLADRSGADQAAATEHQLRELLAKVNARATKEVAGLKKHFGDISKQAKSSWKAEVQRGMQDIQTASQWLQAGAGVLQAGLPLLGPQTQDLQRAVNGAVRYVDGAVQLYRSVGLVLSASSGSGMPVAIMGMLQGGSTVAAFMGSADSPTAGSHQAEVFKCLEELRLLMLEQFKNVNARLDYAIAQLDTALTQLAQLRTEVAVLRTRVEQANEKLNYLAFRSEAAALDVVNELTKQNLASCRGPLADRILTPDSMSTCRTLYAGLSVSLSQPPWMATTGENALPQLSAGFEQITARRSAFWDQAARTSSLGAVAKTSLEQVMGKGLPGLPHFEPMLYEVIDGYIALKAELPSVHAKMNPQETQRQVGTLRTQLQAHQDFVAGLRADKVQELDKHPLLGPLVRRLDEAVQKFEAEVRELVRTDTLAELQRLGESANKDVRLWETTPADGVSVLGASDFGKDVLPLELVACPVACADGAPALSLQAESFKLVSQGDAPHHIVTLNLLARHRGEKVGNFTHVVEFIGRNAPFVAREMGSRPVAGLRNLFSEQQVQVLVREGLAGFGHAKTTVKPGLRASLMSNTALLQALRDRQLALALSAPKDRDALAFALSGATELGGGRHLGLLGAALSMDALCLAIRSVCEFGYSEALEGSDRLQTLFSGPPTASLPFRSTLRPLAEECRKQPTGPSLQDHLKRRAQELKEALQAMLTAHAQRGPGFTYELTRTMLDREFPP